jgi:hypothetical protein
MWRWAHVAWGWVGDRCWDAAECCLRRAREAEHRRRAARHGPPCWLGLGLLPVFAVSLAAMLAAVLEVLAWLTR